MGMPPPDVEISTRLVRRLLDSQLPHLAHLEVVPVTSPGWDNAIFRLGPELSVRLPRRELAATC